LNNPLLAQNHIYILKANIIRSNISSDDNKMFTIRVFLSSVFTFFFFLAISDAKAIFPRNANGDCNVSGQVTLLNLPFCLELALKSAFSLALLQYSHVKTGFVAFCIQYAYTIDSNASFCQDAATQNAPGSILSILIPDLDGDVGIE
jgi:hypothetical protein